MTAVARPGERRRRGSMAGALIRTVLALMVAGLVGGFVLFVEMLDRSEGALPPHADGIVALTGGADRVTDALDLLLGGRAGRLLVSGVNPTTSGLDLTRSRPEARRLLACCISLGYAAESTVGNARETRDWALHHDVRSLIVVTSNYHMPRALAELQDADPNVTLIPYPVVFERGEDRGWWGDGQRLRLLLAEYIKWLIVQARTRLYPAAPYGPVPARG